MTQRRSPIANMDQPSDGDPLRTMTVERVTRADGRYLLYFTWPESEPEVAQSEAPGGEPHDV